MNEYDLAKAFQRIENELIASMVRNMSRHRVEEISEGYEWSMWQAEMLKSLEKYKRVNQKKYGKQFKDINNQLEVLVMIARDQGGLQQEIAILHAIQRGWKYPHMPERTQKMLEVIEGTDNGQLDTLLDMVLAEEKTGSFTGKFFKVNDRKLDALIKATVQDMEKAETAILRKANDDYRKIIFDAQVYANTGAGTYEKAVDMATKDMLSRGLSCVEYANGARHTLADYADMAIRTACKRAYLQGEGEVRKEWGIATVIMNKRGNPCPKCLPWVGKVLIDDVWSGGSKKDKNYPLMSYAISKGLYHPRCRDSHTTYFPGISTADDIWTEEELEAVGQRSRQEAGQQYTERQEKKYDRLVKFSLDEENKKKYEVKHTLWKNKCSTYTHADSVIKNIKDYYSENPDVKIGDLSRKILDEFGLKSISTNMTSMKEWGYCKIKVIGGKLNVVNCNLNKNDARPHAYRVKTAFHEAYHAGADGRKTDYNSIPNKHWLDIEESFAESAAHYLAKEIGINDLTPSYPERIVDILPRLKKLPEYAHCSTISDFGKIAFEERMNGVASNWGNLYNRVNKVEHDWKKYSIQYIPDISKSLDEYIDKMLENMPQYEKYKGSMTEDAKRAMQKVKNAEKLSSNENMVWSNVVSIAMNRLGVR